MSSSTRLICLSVLFSSLFSLTHAARFDVLNNCDFTVWAAAKPGGGMQLAKGQTWGVDVAPGTTQARIWARTNCNFDANGQGRCETGDCNGKLRCEGYGSPPNTLADFALNQPNNLDFMDISLVDGFNVGMDFSPATPGVCRDLKCNADINGQCPAQLKVPGGCNNPCTMFKEEGHCCNNGPCGLTDPSKFFKDRCPIAYSSPKDDPTSVFTCPAGTNYMVTFCPA